MQNKVQLITYADRFGGNTISSLTETLRRHFPGVYEGVHILPFFTPFDGADAGFDPVDHTKVDPRLDLGTTLQNCQRATKSWLTLSSITFPGNQNSSKMS